MAYGMITSALGLLEIPHVVAPAGARELRAAMREQVFEDIAPFPIAFIPGVRNFAGPVNLENFSDMDMMRGEEVEAIGLHRLLAPKGAVLALDMQAFAADGGAVEAYVADKAPLRQAMCDVMEALCAGEAEQVPEEISAQMGLAGAVEIAF